MPPRIHHLPAPPTCQCFRTRPQGVAEAAVTSTQTRHFHKIGREPQLQKLLRRDMWEWLNGPGKVFKEPLPGSTNYLSAYDKFGQLVRVKKQRQNNPRSGRGSTENDSDGDQLQSQAETESGLPPERASDRRPYPLNQDFRSESVLSESLREELHRQVAERGIDVSTVSAAYGVDVRRVAAVVRLKTIEKQWAQDGKPLAKPYNDAVMAMLPQTPFRPDGPANRQITPHESINDLPVHSSTRQQLFYPTSESRQFTREDAAKAFSEDLLPADKRIPHPELIVLEKEALEGIDREKRHQRQRERDQKAQEDRAAAEERKRKWEQRTQRIVPGRRWDFKFQDISAENTGKTGRARNAVGIRYGVPHDDRKSGKIKIPTSVE
ncbi:hypothetical protein TI39_contig5832g00011 [Zymoseptoria brevis]|uniref:Eukaryotic mitochondrial regulator protein-domain-containing protein n=1 Tax=Zymoseptoria brevis TaxID=1047168 RepID=A0A0F4G6J6_9PEZI|nr:hypothetical protein TI39_contig5832g00011 [Zymoseptoria brevis]